MGDQMEYYVVESMLWLWYPYVGVGTRGGCMGGSELAGGSPRRTAPFPWDEPYDLSPAP